MALARWPLSSGNAASLLQADGWRQKHTPERGRRVRDPAAPSAGWATGRSPWRKDTPSRSSARRAAPTASARVRLGRRTPEECYARWTAPRGPLARGTLPSRVDLTVQEGTAEPARTTGGAGRIPDTPLRAAYRAARQR